jgi:LmbE family N-acetylglucosaminyl deacetylase
MLQMNIMIIGAHPDDPEGMAGGTAMLYRALGHQVTMVSMTDGGAGHHRMSREALIARRASETQAAAKVMDVEYFIMPIRDSELQPTLETRNMLLRLIRQKQPDIIITHRPIDYHPDHRYTSQMVTDTSYLLCVPLVVPEVPALRKPVAYFYEADLELVEHRKVICVPIDSVWQRKLQVWYQHTSQMFEWLPWVGGMIDKVPEDETGRIEFLNNWRGGGHMRMAETFRNLMEKNYGTKARDVKYAEAFYSAPVGKKVLQEELITYFPFKI